VESGGVLVSRLRRRRARDEGGFTLVDVIASMVIMGIIIVPLGSVLFQAMKTIPSNGGRAQAATDTSRLESQLIDDINQMQWSNLQTPWNSNGVTPLGNTAMLDQQPAHAIAFKTVAATNYSCVTAVAGPVEPIIGTFNLWDASQNFVYHGATDPFNTFHNNDKVGNQTWIGHVYKMRFTRDARNVALAKVEVFRTVLNYDLTKNVDPLAIPPNPTQVNEAPIMTGYCKTGDTVVTGNAKPVPSGNGNSSEEVNLVFKLRGGPTDNPTSYTIDATSRFAAPPG
jgi:type II secretory pathway pseudopilin PulG